MRFYQQQHRFYCGIDLHARSMYVCIVDANGAIVLHQNLASSPANFLQAIAPYREGLVVAAECMFAWYWVADLCRAEGIPFLLGHALYMKAIHGGKPKNDKIDSHKIATLLRGGTLAQAYVYPAGMRDTRDLLRRRSFLVRQRALLIATFRTRPVSTTCRPSPRSSPSPPIAKELQVAGHFRTRRCGAHRGRPRPIDAFDQQIGEVELYLTRHAKIDDGDTFHRLRSIPGVGKILALIFLYEIHDIRRFAEAGNFLSYARLVRGSHESAGKKKGAPNPKIGNAHLKWAFGEAACLLVRHCERGKTWLVRKEKKHGKAKALAILAAKLGRTVYHLWRKREVFDETRVFGG